MFVTTYPLSHIVNYITLVFTFHLFPIYRLSNFRFSEMEKVNIKAEFFAYNKKYAIALSTHVKSTHHRSQKTRVSFLR